MEELNKAVDELIAYIQSTPEYQNCLEYKERMIQNSELTELVQKIKTTQKLYVKSQFDPSIEQELKSLEEKLCSIPLYISYNQELEKVNLMIDCIRNSFNQYFDQLLNIKKN